MQFTHEVDIWIYFRHTVLIRSLCVNYVIMNCKCYDIICSAAIGVSTDIAAMNFRGAESHFSISNMNFPNSKHFFNQWTAFLCVLTTQIVR